MSLSRRKFLTGAGVAAGAAAASYLGLRSLRGDGRRRASRRASNVKRYENVLLVGIDGLDPRLLEMLIAAGDAPNFARLREQGGSGPLGTVPPAQSPVVWTTLATGTNPGRHGVFDFIQRDPERPLPLLSICRTGGGGLLRTTKYVQPRQNRAFWDVLSDQNVPVTVLRWPVTFPPENINGRMFAGLGVPDITGSLGRYTFYTDDPSSVPEVPPERLVRVDVQDGQVQTVLRGPRVRGVTGQSEATLPLTARWSGEGDGPVTVQVADQELELTPGQWSEWVRVRFSVGPLRKVRGMVKLVLKGRAPSFGLYASPVEIDPQDPALPVTAPGEYARQLAAEIGTYHTLGMPEDTKALDEGCISEEAFIAQCNEVTDERLAMFWHEFERFDGGVFAFVFDTSDRIQHMFWGENACDAEFRVTALSPRIREHYMRMDAFLGDLLGRLDSQTALLVFSDHGFTSYDVSFDLNAWLVGEGLMTLTADPATKTEDEAALYRLVDWSRTQAYGCGFSSLYLNLKGREGNGIVEPSGADELTRRIAERLGEFVDAGTGRRPVHRAYVSAETYAGDQMGNAPDVVVGCSPGYRMGWKTAIGGVAERAIEPNEKHWDGDHIVDPAFVAGSILTNVPLELDGADALDVAPTVLAMLGLSPDQETDGEVLAMREA